MDHLLTRAIVILVVPGVLISCQGDSIAGRDPASARGSETVLTPGAPRPDSLTQLLGYLWSRLRGRPTSTSSTGLRVPRIWGGSDASIRTLDMPSA